MTSDNGPHFQGNYRPFAEEYGFSHVTSSPTYPRSNGFINSQVKSVKETLKKAKRSHSVPNIGLLCLRATPINKKVPSPAELQLGRQVQDNLPRKIQSDHTHADDVISILKERQAQESITMTNTPLLYRAWFQDSKWPFKIQRHWNGSQL